MLDAVWNYLRLDGGRSAASMWGDIERMRRLGMKYEDLPADRVSFLAALEALKAAGRASKVGEVWLPEFVAEVNVERREKQERMLFA